MKIEKIGVVGAGMMGAEIALCFAKAGKEVVLADIRLELSESGKARQEKILDKSIAKGTFPAEEKKNVLNRVIPTDTLKDMADCQFIIEAAAESLEIKSDIFFRLDGLCRRDAIFASNTSSISITKLASSVCEDRAAGFIGTHFNSPASVMKLVEVIPALRTSEETVQTAITLMDEIGKIPVRVKDVTGFGLNRLFHCFYTEACRLVEEGVCSPEDVDKICIYGLGHPMGIFRLLDNLGHDLNLAVDKIMFENYGERFRPSPAIQRLVDAGMLGRKTGKGFYDYTQKTDGNAGGEKS